MALTEAVNSSSNDSSPGSWSMMDLDLDVVGPVTFPKNEHFTEKQSICDLNTKLRHFFGQKSDEMKIRGENRFFCNRQ